MQNQISETTGVSEENSASTEEILDEVVKQNHKIINTSESITELDKLCAELKKMLQD